MSHSEFKKHFKKVDDNKKKTTVTSEYIDEIIESSVIKVDTVFDKCTIVSCKLPNGFIIVEYSACVDPKNYDVKKGIDICMKKIVNKVWELEGYKLQDELHEICDNCCDCDDCLDWT